MAYYCKANGRIEPLCELYEPHLYVHLKEMICKGNFSLSDLLSHVSVALVEYESPNSEQEYLSAINEMGVEI
jgi:molybdopterin-guanine dinucleotide biosynthesis protein A